MPSVILVASIGVGADRVHDPIRRTPSPRLPGVHSEASPESVRSMAGCVQTCVNLADCVGETPHRQNVRKIGEHALALAEKAGAEQDEIRRAALMDQAFLAWRTAARLGRERRRSA
jgi:hypothetical protein